MKKKMTLTDLSVVSIYITVYIIFDLLPSIFLTDINIGNLCKHAIITHVCSPFPSFNPLLHKQQNRCL